MSKILTIVLCLCFFASFGLIDQGRTGQALVQSGVFASLTYLSCKNDLRKEERK